MSFLALWNFGLGKLAISADGQGYCKPTVTVLYQEPIKEVLRTVLDLAPKDVFHTLVYEPTSANMDCSQDPIDADAEIKTHQAKRIPSTQYGGYVTIPESDGHKFNMQQIWIPERNTFQNSSCTQRHGQWFKRQSGKARNVV